MISLQQSCLFDRFSDGPAVAAVPPVNARAQRLHHDIAHPVDDAGYVVHDGGGACAAWMKLAVACGVAAALRDL